jgi:hypothetical protein
MLDRAYISTTNSSDRFAVAEDGRDGEPQVRLRCPEPVHGLAHAVWTCHFEMNVIDPALAQDRQN